MYSYFLTIDSFILTLDKDLITEIVFQLINTGILCAVLGWLLYKPVLKFMNARKERIATDISEGKKARKSAEEVLAEYKARLAELEAKKAEILETAQLEAKANRTEIIAQANKEAESIKARAELQMLREQERAKDEMRFQIIQVSSLIASRFVKESLSQTGQNEIVEDVIKGLGDVKWQS